MKVNRAAKTTKKLERELLQKDEDLARQKQQDAPPQWEETALQAGFSDRTKHITSLAAELGMSRQRVRRSVQSCAVAWLESEEQYPQIPDVKQ